MPVRRAEEKSHRVSTPQSVKQRAIHQFFSSPRRGRRDMITWNDRANSYWQPGQFVDDKDSAGGWSNNTDKQKSVGSLSKPISDKHMPISTPDLLPYQRPRTTTSAMSITLRPTRRPQSCVLTIVPCEIERPCSAHPIYKKWLAAFFSPRSFAHKAVSLLRPDLTWET